MKDLDSENYTTLMKEIEENTNRWKDISHSWIGTINTGKMTILPKVIYRFNEIPIKLPMIFFKELEEIFLKIVWKLKRSWEIKTILRKKNRVRGIILFVIQTMSTVINERGHRNKPMHLWSKEARIYDGEGLLNWTATGKRMKLGRLVTPYTKKPSNWVKDLNVRLYTIKLLEENINRKLFDRNHSYILFLHLSPKQTK